MGFVMSPVITSVSGAEIARHMPALATLRVRVFREWPYLYEGDLSDEERHLELYARSPSALVVLASARGRTVGASTAILLEEEPEEVRSPLVAAGFDPRATLYCGESVLEHEWRGQGLGVRFFEERERHARALGLRHAAFCRVVRPADHPARPAGEVPLDGFWRHRGYAPLPGVYTTFSWREVGGEIAIDHRMEFWAKSLA